MDPFRNYKTMSLMLNLLVGLILFANHAAVYANSTNQEFAKSVPIVDMHMHLFGKRPISIKNSWIAMG